MSAPRFFVAPADVALTPHSELALPIAVARHAVQVLRLRDAASIVVFDGTGGEYAATLSLRGREAHAVIGAHVDVERESAVALTLVQALVAHDVMDAIVRKAVELGVGTIQPVLAERSQRGPSERLERRAERWRQIAIAACEQCGRNRVPAIEALVPLREWLATRGALQATALLDPSADRALGTPNDAVTTVLVGPEGGFSEAESADCVRAGAQPRHLGPRILRADTAALAALATLGAAHAR